MQLGSLSLREGLSLQQKGLQPCASHKQGVRREAVITAGPSAISPSHSSLVLLVSVQGG